MVSSYTPNKGLEKPANGDYVDTWNVPVNSDMDVIDQAFGGVTNLNATSGSATLTSAQYRSLIINVSGAIAAPVTYTIPSAVGGQWVVRNTTTDSSGGPHAVTFASGGGGASIAIPRDNQVLIYSDGTNVRLSLIASTSVIADQAVTVGKLPNGVLSADATGRAKMADSFVNTPKLDDASVTISKISATGTPSSNTFLRGDGSWSVSSNTIPTIVAFTANGTFTVPANITRVRVTVVGGGGGGGGANDTLGGGGGGGGGTAIKVISGLTPGASIAVTVGAGGTAAGGGGTGGTGGTSSFGAFCSASGGSGGTGGPGFGGAGGVGTNGDLNFTGNGGGAGNAQGGVSGGSGGHGGSSIFPGGAAGIPIFQGPGNAGAANSGGGGGGGNRAASNVGGAGGSGIVIVEY